ncbi:MAG: Rho-binding antiterminator [Gammaproteobacteria bacterium]
MDKGFIACQLHDYIEIACMYRYRVRLTLRNHEILEGTAVDTITTAQKRECLVIDNGLKQPVDLNQLKKLEVLTPNARFREVVF